MALGTRDQHATVWVCVDCYMSHAGIDERERGEAYPVATLSLFGPGEELTAGLMSDEHDEDCAYRRGEGDLDCECGCDRREFSWAPCEGCGSSLGGSREALTVWWQ